jgi:NADH dehydrogenase
MQMMLKVIRRRRLIVSVPFWIAGIMGGAFDLLQAVTLGLFHNGLLTRDQVKNLRQDNVVTEGRKSFKDLGIHPTTMELVVEDYLWPYRPSGQYNVIKESAERLKRS